MFPTFERAMQRRPCRIAGLTIPPLTLARAYCLHAWRSPLVCGGRVELADFGLALWTCRQPCYPFARFVRDVNRGAPDRALKRLGKRYDLRRFDDDVAALSEHIEWHCKTPPRFFPKQSASSGACAPWPMVVAVQVIPVFGERATWMAPVPLAMAYKIALDNSKGDTSWKSEAEEARGYANARDTQSDK
ncbi:MAG: hypothetical protein ABIH03_07605 [Pseudomonadota bacterium]